MMAISSSTTSVPLMILRAFLFGLVMLPQHCMAIDFLVTGDSMPSGEKLISGPYVLQMQENCNLVLYDNQNILWSSDTVNRGTNCKLVMREDGDLVIMDDATEAMVWASGTSGRIFWKGILVLRWDGKVVIYGTGLFAMGVLPLPPPPPPPESATQRPQASPAAARHLHHAVINADNSTAQPIN